MSFSAQDAEHSINRLTQVLDLVQTWFTFNKLSLNPDKTEYMLIGTWQQHKKLEDRNLSFSFGGHNIEPSDKFRNLGFFMDKHLILKSHVSKICQISYYHIRNFRRIRDHLDLNSAKLLANALVSSRLDYCNSLLYGINEGLSKKLQTVQNSLARVVVPSVKRTDHISPVLKQLHWLKVSQRIKFKIALLTYKVLKFSQPSYLSNLLTRKPLSNRRSSGKNLLEIPLIKSEYGRRSYTYAAPVVWNSLPQEIRDCTSEHAFRKKLKTHLFPT